jgi:4-amino-4-deoxychorismate lyase
MKALLELLVNGRMATPDWPLDRGLMYGDGLFETMLARGGRIRFEDLHRARLDAGCKRLAIHADQDAIWKQARAAAAKHVDSLLRLQVTRGVALARGYTPTGGEAATTILAAFAQSADPVMPPYLRVRTLESTLGENPALAGLKHCNRLEQILARHALAGSNALEGLMASSSGLVISGTMSNVFVELDGELVTPSLERCGVAGVLRAAVLREAARAGVPVRVADVPLAALARVNAAALCNVRMGLVPVDELDGRQLTHNAGLTMLAAQVAELEA